MQDSASDCLFLTWEWLYSWWRHLSAAHKLHILVVHYGGEIAGIAPMTENPRDLARIRLSRSIEFLGTGTAGSDYLDVIARRGHEADVAAALANWFCEHRSMLMLTQVRSEALAMQLAAAMEASHWKVNADLTGTCPFIDLSALSWDSYLRTVSSNHRYNFGRYSRRLDQGFQPRLELVSAEDQREPALNQLWDLHTRRWQPRGGSDGLNSPALFAFHQDVTRLTLARGWLRLYVLYLENAPAAALYGFLYGRRFLYYQAGFHPALARLSLGVVMLGMVIRRAIEEGAVEFDMLHGQEDYKFHWTRSTRRLARVEIYPPHGLGLVCRSAVRLNRTSRRMARTLLPKGVAARVAAAVNR